MIHAQRLRVMLLLAVTLAVIDLSRADAVINMSPCADLPTSPVSPLHRVAPQRIYIMVAAGPRVGDLQCVIVLQVISLLFYGLYVARLLFVSNALCIQYLLLISDRYATGVTTIWQVGGDVKQTPDNAGQALEHTPNADILDPDDGLSANDTYLGSASLFQFHVDNHLLNESSRILLQAALFNGIRLIGPYRHLTLAANNLPNFIPRRLLCLESHSIDRILSLRLDRHIIWHCRPETRPLLCLLVRRNQHRPPLMLPSVTQPALNTAPDSGTYCDSSPNSHTDDSTIDVLDPDPLVPNIVADSVYFNHCEKDIDPSQQARDPLPSCCRTDPVPNLVDIDHRGYVAISTAAVLIVIVLCLLTGLFVSNGQNSRLHLIRVLKNSKQMQPIIIMYD